MIAWRHDLCQLATRWKLNLWMRNWKDRNADRWILAIPLVQQRAKRRLRTNQNERNNSRGKFSSLTTCVRWRRVPIRLPSKSAFGGGGKVLDESFMFQLEILTSKLASACNLLNYSWVQYYFRWSFCWYCWIELISIFSVGVSEEIGSRLMSDRVVVMDEHLVGSCDWSHEMRSSEERDWSHEWSMKIAC